jgi:nucleotidyltransferase substrate binding protein (TIGR01987 family)
MVLDLSSFEKAIGQLDKMYALALSDLAKSDPDLEQAFRMAAIQAFEFTYELCFRMLKRFLKLSEPSPDGIDDATFQSLIRLACERDLLRSDLPRWMDYRRKRGTTSHTYDEGKALEVFSVIPDFVREARHLYETLNERTASL